MRERSLNRGGYAIAANKGLAGDIQDRIRVQARRKIDQAASDLEWVIAKIQRPPRRGDAAFDQRVPYFAVKLQIHRRYQISEVVPHNQSVAAFDAELVEYRSLRKLEFAAFFNRSLRTLIDQLSEIDVLGVLGAPHMDVPADELNVLRSPQFDIGIDGGAKIFRITQGHVGAVDVKEKLRNREARELRAAGGGDFAGAEPGLESLNLRLGGIEDQRGVEIRQRDALVAEQDRNRTAVNRGPARQARLLVGSAQIDVQPGKA